MGRILRLIVVPIVLLAGSARAQDSAMVIAPGASRTVNVEVVAYDPQTRTLSFRTNNVESSFAVDPAATAALGTVQPGDRVAVTLRDGSDHRQFVSAVVTGTASAGMGSAMRGERITVRGIPGAPVEVVSTDSSAGTIKLRTDGSEHVYVLGPDASSVLDGIGAGDKVMLSWRFNKSGQPEAVIRPAPASMVVEKTVTSVETASTGPGPVRVVRPAGTITTGLPEPAREAALRMVRGPVDVVAVDIPTHSLTVLDEHGEQRMVPLDDKAVYGLADIRPGNRVDLSWGANGKVVYINVH
jgi:hypothetical protein